MPGMSKIVPAFQSTKIECYSWSDATNPQSLRPYKFGHMDLTCDEGRVWQCYGAECNKNKPSNGLDWVLLRNVPKQIVPTVFTWIEAYKWIKNENYLPGDYAIDLISGFIFTCSGFPLTLDCSFLRPTDTAITKVWLLQQGYAVKNVIQNTETYKY